MNQYIFGRIQGLDETASRRVASEALAAIDEAYNRLGALRTMLLLGTKPDDHTADYITNALPKCLDNTARDLRRIKY